MDNKSMARVVLLLAASPYLASASIILVSPFEQSGTGLGAVNTVLTLQSPGKATIEPGCVAPMRVGTTTSGCNFANNAVQALFDTLTLSAAGVTADLRIVLNASEPNSAPDIQLNPLVLTLYNGAGPAIDVHTLPVPILFPNMPVPCCVFFVENATATSGTVGGGGAVPELSPLVLIGAGLVGLGALKGRRHSA